jgi:hypothetical protein
MTTTKDSTSKYVTASNTVAQPAPAQAAPIVITGTVGYSGRVEYSKMRSAVINETYVIKAKK